jgi:hypothetical protein
MAEASINVEVFPGITPTGIYASVYIGDSEDPIQVEECWQNIIDTEIDSYVVPNKERPIVVDRLVGADGVQEAMDTVTMLRDVADRLEAALKERPIFIRDEWVSQSSGDDLSEFCVTYEEYLNKILGYGE